MRVITARPPGTSRSALAAAALTVLLLIPAAAVASPNDKLDDARQRLEDIRDQLDQVGATCERNKQRVAELNTGVEDTLVAVGEAEGVVEQQRRMVGRTEGQLNDLAAEAAKVQATSRARVVELYKRGASDPTMQTLLASPTTQEALTRAQILTVVEHSDRGALEQLLASRTAVDAQRDLLAQQQRAYDEVLDEREQILVQLQQLQTTYERKVGRCNDRLAGLQRQQEIASADEERLAAALAERSPAAIPPSASAGGWSWPASGPLTSGFGQRWGRLHAGIDIGAPTGAPIYAAKGGVVSYAGVMGGYGNIIVIDHGGGMTTRYAHQSQLAAGVGQTVRPGDQIGYIGSTGNVTGPHLHFEVRVNDQPQNPIGYLP